MSWLVRIAATAIAVGTPTAASTPAMPMEPTAVPPPGIGTSDAMVDTPIFAAGSVQ